MPPLTCTVGTALSNRTIKQLQKPKTILDVQQSTFLSMVTIVLKHGSSSAFLIRSKGILAWGFGRQLARKLSEMSTHRCTSHGQSSTGQQPHGMQKPGPHFEHATDTYLTNYYLQLGLHATKIRTYDLIFLIAKDWK